MTYRLRLLLCVLVAALLVLPGAAWELRVTNNDFVQQDPDISGTKVVWEDNRNGNWDIYMFDAATGQTRRLTDEPHDQINPQISGHIVVWQDYRNSVRQNENPDIYKYDLRTDEVGIVHPPSENTFGGYQCNPAIDDTNGVVVATWVEQAEGISEQARVFYRYLEGGTRYQQVYQDSNLQAGPWVSDQKVVWTDNDLGGVYFRYVSDSDPYTTAHVLERATNDTIDGLRISGERIVWSQYRPESMEYNIRAFRLNPDLQSGIGSWVSPGDRFQTEPALDGNILVWRDERSGAADVYLYDFGTGQERALVTAPGEQRQPAIDGSLVAFTDTRNGNPEIYLVPVSSSVPLPGLATVPGGTGAPRDLDTDGRCEDVNGNGRADFADVVLYFNQMSWIAANMPSASFDYNGNGRIDFADVVWLFNHL
jgi:beta propeller repeat protein